MRNNPFYFTSALFLILLLGGNQIAASMKLIPSKEAVRSLRRSARRRFDAVFAEDDDLLLTSK